MAGPCGLKNTELGSAVFHLGREVSTLGPLVQHGEPCKTGTHAFFAVQGCKKRGIKGAVGRWLREATLVGLGSPDRRDDLAMPDSLADCRAPRGPAQRAPETGKSVRPENAR